LICRSKPKRIFAAQYCSAYIRVFKKIAHWLLLIELQPATLAGSQRRWLRSERSHTL